MCTATLFWFITFQELFSILFLHVLSLHFQRTFPLGFRDQKQNKGYGDEADTSVHVVKSIGVDLFLDVALKSVKKLL